MNDTNKINQMRIFFLVWFGQMFSLIGSGLTGFALGVWVFLQTGSATHFAMICLSAMLPGIIFSPVAGVLVDRWDRRLAMILSDTGAALCTLIIAILVWLGKLEIWHICIINAVTSIFNSLQWPAYSAATTLLVPKHHLGRANGMIQFGMSVSELIAPALGGILLVWIHLYGILLIDLTTFLFALATLVFVRFPKAEASAAGKESKGSFFREALFGWQYISARSGLVGLLSFFALSNFLIGIVMVLATPLVLSFSSPAVLGTILSIGGAGMVAGSLLMSAWGGPKKLVNGIFCFTIVAGLSIFLAGLSENPVLLSIAAFCFFFGMPITAGCSQTIWQKKVEPDIQGRVFAVRRMIALSSLPLAYIIAGPLADKAFEPLMASGAVGILAESVGQIIGTGPGRGIGLIFIIMGLLTIVATVFAYFFFHRMRMVEEELPDAVR